MWFGGASSIACGIYVLCCAGGNLFVVVDVRADVVFGVDAVFGHVNIRFFHV